MATAQDRARNAGPPQVLCVGMLRTGTNSLAAALRLLGFKHVFHGLDSRTKPSHWDFFEKAAIAKWPEINANGMSPQPSPFTREDWDKLFGVYDAVTDLSCFWALDLIDAYPEAKVILTERDYENWIASFDSQVLRPLFGPFVDIFLKGVGTIIGNRAGFAMQKTIRGFFGGASSLEELHRAAPAVYRQHSERIKAHVASERLLVYRVGKDGWEPLCDFLDKEVPNTAFPFENDKEAHTKSDMAIRRQANIHAARIVVTSAVGVVLAWCLWVNGVAFKWV